MHDKENYPKSWDDMKDDCKTPENNTFSLGSYLSQPKPKAILSLNENIQKALISILGRITSI
jgi:hypothetical protein